MVQDYEIPIKTMKDLQSHPSYKLMLLGGTSGETYLRDSVNPDIQKVWERVVSDKGNLTSLLDVDEKLLSDPYNVLFYSYPDIPMMYDSYPCKITADKSSALSEYGSYAFHKESPYVALFTHHLYYIEEQGLETEYFDQQEEKSVTCDEDGESTFISITFDGVISAFALVGIGCMVATTFLFAERTFSDCYMTIYNYKDMTKRPISLPNPKVKLPINPLNVSKTSKFSRHDEISS